METFIGKMVLNHSGKNPNSGDKKNQWALRIEETTHVKSSGRIFFWTFGKHMAMGWYLGAQAMKMAISIGFLGHKLGSMI